MSFDLLRQKHWFQCLYVLTWCALWGAVALFAFPDVFLGFWSGARTVTGWQRLGVLAVSILWIWPLLDLLLSSAPLPNAVLRQPVDGPKILRFILFAAIGALIPVVWYAIRPYR